MQKIGIAKIEGPTRQGCLLLNANKCEIRDLEKIARTDNSYTTGQLSVISEINERGQRKEAKMEALKELVIKHDTKSNKGMLVYYFSGS